MYCVGAAFDFSFTFIEKVPMKNFTRLSKPAVLFTCLALLGSSFLSGCATTSYGQAPTRDEKVANQFRFKIYLSAFSGADTADKNAKVEIEKHMTKEGYKSYKIADRRYNLLPEYYEYTVNFTR